MVRWGCLLLMVAVAAGCDDSGASRHDSGVLIPRDARPPAPDQQVADAQPLDARSPDAAPPRDGGAPPDARLDAAPPADSGLDAPADAAPDAARARDQGPDEAVDATLRDPCADVIDLNAEIAARGYYDGTTAGAPATTLGSCGGGAGGEVLLRYTVAPGEVEVVFATDYPETQAATVLYVRAACDAVADLACVRGNDAAPGTRLVFHPAGPGVVYVVVDTGSRAGGGPFRLTAGPPPPPACADARDNDGDGRLDLDDPGCTGPDDDSEGDPPTPPLCADGLDNDEDGLTDFPQDPDCLAAGDNGESGACMPEGPCDGRNMGPGFLDGSSTGGPWIAFRWRPEVGGVVTRLDLFSGEAQGATALGLYTADPQTHAPGQRLARGAFNLARPNDWQGGDLDAPAEVQGNTDYWIVWETVGGAQSPFDVAGEDVDYRGSPDQGRTWNGPFRAPVKYRVHCCQD